MKYVINVPEDMVKEGFVVKCEQAFCGNNRRVVANLFPEEYEEPDRSVIEDEVWEFVRIITDMTERQRIECFGEAYCNLDKYRTYQDAKAKYEEWKKKKDRIRVGDEVEYPPNKAKGIVIKCHVSDVYAEVDKYAVFTGTSVEYLPIEWLRKTGRIFPEVAELLKKMKEE